MTTDARFSVPSLPPTPVTPHPAPESAPRAGRAHGHPRPRPFFADLMRQDDAWPFLARNVTVSVPATCANLGPGFDCLALALCLRNTFEVTVQPRLPGHSGPPPRAYVQVFGAVQDTQYVSHKRENLFVAAFRRLCELRGVALPLVSVRIRMNLPPSRGLGSSATAVVGGLLAANTLLGEPLSRDELLHLAVQCEPGHHADNVAAALYGGLVVTGVRDAADGLITLPVPVPLDLRTVLFIPDMPMSTVRGRSLLPATYSRTDVTFNLSRVALLLAALQTGRLDLLTPAMDDRIHQPYREQIFPALREFVAAACAAGAHGACLSGGGSSVLALVTSEAQAVATAFDHTAQTLGIGGRSYVAEISRAGATVHLPGHDATASDCGDGASGQEAHNA